MSIVYTIGHEDQTADVHVQAMQPRVGAAQAGSPAPLCGLQVTVLAHVAEGQGPMIRAFRYPLLPNTTQTRVLDTWLERCRALYNAALEQKITAYRMTGKSPSVYDQMKDLTELREADPEYAAVPSDISRSVLRRLDRAYQNFFRRVKAHASKAGFPRFRGRGWYDSFSFPPMKIVGNKIGVPKLGHVKFHRYREFTGKVLEVTIRRGASRWWVSLTCDVGPAPEKKPVRLDRVVGIDLGLTHFAVLSTGEKVGNPRFFKRAQDRLAWHQRVLSRKSKGSRNRTEAKRVVARTHERIQEQRRDFSCKLATDLFRRFDLVAYEDLNVKGMIEDGKLSKSIHDAAWSKAIETIQAKAESAGLWVVPVDPRGTSQRCSRCGMTVPKTLRERVHRCPFCGLCIDRDENAALNIRLLAQAPGSGAVAPAWAESPNQDTTH